MNMDKAQGYTAKAQNSEYSKLLLVPEKWEDLPTRTLQTKNQKTRKNTKKLIEVS